MSTQAILDFDKKYNPKDTHHFGWGFDEETNAIKSFLEKAINEAREEERKRIIKWMSVEYGVPEDVYNEILKGK